MRRIPSEAIFLRENDARTLQGRLAAAIVRAVLESRALPGTRLPSSRQLAQALSISRMTVTLVYQDLVSQGYLETILRSGIAVASTVPHHCLPLLAHGRTGIQASWDDWLSDHKLPQRIIRKPTDWRKYKFPFIYGQVDSQLFDHNAWRDCARRALGTREFAELGADQYGADDTLLIDYICSNTLPRRGIHANPSEVLVTMGAQNALFLAIELLARADRLAVMEEPGYPDFAEVLRRGQSPAVFLPVDHDGLRPDLIPDGTRLVIATPSHHIPTGATMPVARRYELLSLAADDDFLIIEDDYDFEMSYLASPVPALKSLDSTGRVIYIGSFSKSLFPGLRIGYMVAPAPFIASARALRTMMLRHPPPHLQRITAYFLALGHYDAHIARLRDALRHKRALLESALSCSSLKIVGAATSGGASHWLRAPEGWDSEDLAIALREDSVLIEPGSVFYETPPKPCPYFRIGFAAIAADAIGPGIELIDRRVSFGPQPSKFV